MQADIRIASDNSVVVQFDRVISIENNNKVLSLMKDLKRRNIPGIVEMVPTYASLTVYYSPIIISYAAIYGVLKDIISELSDDYTAKTKKTVIEIPVMYGGPFDTDLEKCAHLEDVSVEELIRIHTSSDYYVFFLGFSPGHPYTARFENPFSFDRLHSPRIQIRSGSIVARKNFTDIIPFNQPCGWYILGYTPLHICDFSKKEPFMLKAGDWVRYIPVNEREYELIRNDYKNGKYVVRTTEIEIKQ